MELHLLAQYHGMARSDDAYLRAEGKKLIAEAAEQALAKRLANARAAENAALPRPGAENPIRQRVLAMMKSRKAAGTEFKRLMEAWEMDALAGLRLSVVAPGAEYKVDDEDATDPPIVYKWSTLRKLYSTC